MNADQFNDSYQVGTPVFAYPGARPEDVSNATRLVARTRSEASVLGGHTDVVWVDGHSACIALSHVDVVTEGQYEAAKLAEAVAAQGAVARSRSFLDRARDALGARMSKDDLRLVLENTIAYAAGLESERHITNEALDDAAKALRIHRDRIDALATRLRKGQTWQPGRNPEMVSQDYVSQDELRAIFGIPLTAPWDDPAEVPQTERSRMVAIADALNAAEKAGLPLGIDLDGTITDHNAWSVVWLSTEKRWTVAGWEDGEAAESGGAS